MPSNPDMTLRQLADVVAYLKSLTSGGHPPAHVFMRPGAAASAPPAWGYLAQAYEINDAQIDAFYRWFDRAEFRTFDGLVSIDTYASRLRDGRHLLLCIFGFESDLALSRFAERRANTAAHPDDFVRPVRPYVLETPALYRAPQMSWP